MLNDLFKRTTDIWFNKVIVERMLKQMLKPFKQAISVPDTIVLVDFSNRIWREGISLFSTVIKVKPHKRIPGMHVKTPSSVRGRQSGWGWGEIGTRMFPGGHLARLVNFDPSIIQIN